MSIIEKQTPQKVKPFKEYKQDHGDAAGQVLRAGDFTDWAGQARDKRNAEALAASLNDTDYTSMTSAELDKEADKILGEPNELVYSTQPDVDLEEDDEPATGEHDRFATEAEVGLKSKRDIAKEIARRATLDPHEDDDLGDDDYHSPMRITNRL